MHDVDDAHGHLRQRPRRRWVTWAVNLLAGLLLGALAWWAVSLWAWFDAGGTLGGYGASASADVDWGRYDANLARRTWIAVAVGAALPAVWAVRSLRSASTNRARSTARAGVVAVVLVAVALALTPVVQLARAQDAALEPDAAALAELRSEVAVPLERSLEKPTEDGPWIAAYRALGFAGAEDVPSTQLHPPGEWWCRPGDPREWWFRADDGSWSVLEADASGTALAASPSGPSGADELVRCDGA